MTVAKGARVPGVTRQTPNNLVNGRAGISPEMAIRLAKAFGIWTEVWLGKQTAYDLVRVRQHEGRIKVRHVARLPEYADSRTR